MTLTYISPFSRSYNLLEKYEMPQSQSRDQRVAPRRRDSRTHERTYAAIELIATNQRVPVLQYKMWFTEVKYTKS